MQTGGLGVLDSFLGITSLKVGGGLDDLSLWTAAPPQRLGSVTPRLNLSTALGPAGVLREAEANLPRQLEAAQRVPGAPGAGPARSR